MAGDTPSYDYDCVSYVSCVSCIDSVLATLVTLVAVEATVLNETGKKFSERWEGGELVSWALTIDLKPQAHQGCVKLLSQKQAEDNTGQTVGDCVWVVVGRLALSETLSLPCGALRPPLQPGCYITSPTPSTPYTPTTAMHKVTHVHSNT